MYLNVLTAKHCPSLSFKFPMFVVSFRGLFLWKYLSGINKLICVNSKKPQQSRLQIFVLLTFCFLVNIFFSISYLKNILPVYITDVNGPDTLKNIPMFTEQP